MSVFSRRVLLNVARGTIIAVIIIAAWRFGGVELPDQRWLYAGVLAALGCWLIAAAIEVRGHGSQGPEGSDSPQPPETPAAVPVLSEAVRKGGQAPSVLWPLARQTTTSGSQSPFSDSLSGSADPAIGRLPVALVFLIAALLLGAVQLVPLGGGWASERAGRIGVTTSAGEAQPSTDALPSGSPAAPRSSALSLYPASTRLELAHLAVAVAAFCLGAALFAGSTAQVWLWGALAVNGGVMAFLAIAHKIAPVAGPFAWVPTHSGSPFASFINKNNAAGFLMLCLAGGLGFLIWTLRPGWSSSNAARPTRSARAGSRNALRRLRERVAQLDALPLVALTLVVLIVAGILASLSRGGIVALAGAALITAVATLRTRRVAVAGLALALAALLSLGLLRWTGLSAGVSERLATVLDRHVIDDVRLSNWRDALQAVPEFPLVGTGLGTYRYAYPPYQQRLAESWHYHAENQYVQALVEGGIAGLLLVLGAIAAVAVAVRSLLRSTAPPNGEPSRTLRASGTVAVVGTFALASQSLHALFDFGLYIPSNMLAFAVLCGAVCGAAARAADPDRAWSLVALPGLRPAVVLIVMAGILLNAVQGVRELSAAGSARAAMALVPSTAPAPWDDPPAGAALVPASSRPLAERIAEVDSLIARLSAAAKRRPDDAELHQSLARLWIDRYRLHTWGLLEGRLPPQIAAAPAAEIRRELWDLTELRVLHLRANQFERAADRTALRALRTDEVVVENLRPAAVHLRAAQAACPILPQVDLELAALAFLLGDGSPAGVRHLERAVRLAPADPDVLYAAGVLAHNAERPDLAHPWWRSSLSLTPRYRGDVLELATARWPLQRVIDEVLPQSPAALLEMARGRYAGEERAAERGLLLSRTSQLLADQRSRWPEPEWHALTAATRALEQRPDEAIEAYRRALVLEPRRVDWRLELVGLLRAAGDLEEAHAEARRCALLEPDRHDVQALARELNRLRVRGDGTAATRSAGLNY